MDTCSCKDIKDIGYLLYLKGKFPFPSEKMVLGSKDLGFMYLKF